MAAAITSDRTSGDSGVGRTALQLGLAVFFSMNVMVFTMALWSWDTYSIATAPNAMILKELLRFACLLFATPVVLVLGKPLVTSVAGQLHDGTVTTDLLLVLGVAAAFAYSVASLVSGQPHVYFEVACTILVAVTLGRWFEAEGKHRAMNSLRSLQNLLPATARIVGSDGTVETRPLEEITVGQVLRVLPGERLPLDGTVHVGRSFVDQQLVTGECRAVCRSTGDPVFGGTLNLDGCLDMRVDAEPAAGVIQRLVKSVREAANQTCRPQRLADRLATFFVPIVFVIAVIVFVAHWKSSNLNTAFMSSMAVALIACPCALAIATPLAIWAALANAAKHGVVFRTSEDLSALSDVDYVCIDKTGTLTTDEPRLAGQWYEDDESQDAVRDIAIQLAAQSLHPLAAALGKWLDHPTGAGNISIAPAILRPGRGVCAELTIPSAGDMELSTMAALGSSQFCVELRFDISERLRRTRDEAIEHGLSVTCVGWDSQVRAVFAFEESLRPDAAASVRALRIRGLDTMLLTGDQTERAKRIAAEIDVSLAANLLPGDKLRIVSELQAEGHHVAMLGDGLNDAPALSAADVGIALGCGADVTRDAADVCLLSPAPALLPWAIDLARTTQRTIRRNLIWAVGYNSIGIALAASGRLNPIFAALAMVFSSAFVIAESLRLAALPGPVSQVSLEHTAASRDHIHSGQTELLAAGVPSQ